MYFYRSRIEAVVSCRELPGIGLLVWLAFHMCTGDLHYLIPILPVFAERHFFHARDSNLYFQSWTETWDARWDRERVSPRQRADRTHRGRSLGLPQGKSGLLMMSRCNLFFFQSCFTFQPPTGCCWTDDDWMVGLLRTPRPLVIYIVNSKFEFQMERKIILLLILSIQLKLPYSVIFEHSGSCFVMMCTSTIHPLSTDGSEIDLVV